MNGPAYELEQVGRVLGEQVKQPVLSDIDLSIAQGEFVALTGASGSGKSTLLYLLGALDVPTTGTVRILGRSSGGMGDAERAELRLRHIGFVFQFHFLLAELSAAENVALPMMRSGERRRDALRRAAEILERLDIGHLAARRPVAMSGGEQQRVAIARAVAHGPRIVLADEPTGSLDSENTERVMRLLEQLNAEDALTIVMVTHDEGLAGRAGRRIVLRDGRVIEDRARHDG